MCEQQNQQVVENFWKAFSAGDVEKTLSFLSDDGFSWWILGDPKDFALAGTRDKAAFAELLSGVLTEAPGGLSMTPSAWTCQGDRVAMEAESYGYVGDKLYNNLYHFLHVVKDGKIRQVKEYLDTSHAAAVLC